MLSKLGSHVRHNVVGYIALFFALSGVAYAAGPLKPGDPAGGDLSGTYPNPSIATNAVNSGKVSDNSLTGDDVDESSLGKVGDADTLDGKDSTEFVGATTLVRRTLNAAGVGLGAHSCATFTNVGLPGGNPGDPVFVSAAYGAGVVVSASKAAGTPGSVSTNFQVCNSTDGFASFPGGQVPLLLISG
jgi:hypothetical protein